MMNPKLFIHLISRLRKIEQQIQGEMKYRMPNPLRLLRLKRLRVKVKDRLFLLTAPLGTTDRRTT